MTDLKEMIEAGLSASTSPLSRYKAMLAAAPAVQGEPETMKLYDKYRRGVE